MKQSNEEMYHSKANVLAIMPLSTSFPSDVNEKAELQGVDTYVTLINDIGQMACDVDLMAGINQNTGTTALQNSLVRNIKKKNRKEHKLPEYEYPLVLGRQMKPSDSGVVNQGDYDSKPEMEDDIIEVDNVADPDRTFSLFDLTNRLPIWKLLSTQEKEKLKEAYEKRGDSTQVWTGPHVSNSVSFNDIRPIVKELTLRGNVIDAYTEMLMYEQQMKAPKSADDEKSYIFSTLCLATIRDVAEDVRDRYLALRAPHALNARYIQFPIHLDNHWTLMVYDTKEGFWLHYNSMKPRRGREDKHYWEASLLKSYFEDYINHRLKVGTVETQDLVKELLVVDYCPQQKLDSNDCGIIVCFIMKQLVRHLDVDKSMGGESCRTMRAGMVKSFVNDRRRSFVAGN